VNTTAVAVGTSGVAVAGRWSQDKPLDIKMAVGLGVYVLCLATFSAVDEKMGLSFALISLFSATALYLPDIVKKLGYSSGA
jgi:phenolic acid decarboxylase